MKLLYICSAGTRRSAALAAYTKHFKGDYGLESLEVAHAAVSSEKLARESERFPRRLRACERALFGKYHREAARLKESSANVHPRIGVLLLKEGVDEIIRQQPLALSRDIIQGNDFVLTTGTGIRDRVRQMAGHSNIYTVKEFIRYPADDHDIPDVFYKLPFTWHQLWRDSNFCTALKGYSYLVLGKLAREARCYE